MALPPRSATHTEASQATAVDRSERRKQTKSPSNLSLEAKTPDKQDPPSRSATSDIDVEKAQGFESLDSDPATAPKECSLEEALSAGYLYPFDAVLTALHTDNEGGLTGKLVKERQVSSRTE